ncbi:hypothetical protein NDU88_005116 [Pleurodeles waltl]|uniref:Uncharacterized protein n=1 Tax=Pleurodeles waltl TaxID=8319 RepID=A0AAV7WTU4_PLEWA|nr:hypothetical protein NDU88_005116 [Pleurodeles waltl]
MATASDAPYWAWQISCFRWLMGPVIEPRIPATPSKAPTASGRLQWSRKQHNRARLTWCCRRQVDDRNGAVAHEWNENRQSQGETVKDRCRLNKEDPARHEPAGAPSESGSRRYAAKGGGVLRILPPVDLSRHRGGAAGSADRCALYGNHLGVRRQLLRDLSVAEQDLRQAEVQAAGRIASPSQLQKYRLGRGVAESALSHHDLRTRMALQHAQGDRSGR